MPYEKEHGQKVLCISDGRPIYKSIKNPFQKNEFGEHIRDDIGNQVYLHPLLNPQLQSPRLWEKNFDTIVNSDENGKELRIKDYWRISQIDDIHPSFLEQLTIQISDRKSVV